MVTPIIATSKNVIDNKEKNEKIITGNASSSSKFNNNNNNY